jgi:hypothetical protein
MSLRIVTALLQPSGLPEWNPKAGKIRGPCQAAVHAHSKFKSSILTLQQWWHSCRQSRVMEEAPAGYLCCKPKVGIDANELSA